MSGHSRIISKHRRLRSGIPYPRFTDLLALEGFPLQGTGS